jgi:hypothetical protein
MSKFGSTFLDWKELFIPGSFKEFKIFSPFASNKIFSPNVSWEKTIFLAELSRLAYTKDIALREKILKKFNLEEKLFYSNKGSQFILLVNNNNVSLKYICCFRGTDDFYDYKNILTFGKTTWKDKGIVYKGFKNSFDNIEEEIIKISDEIKNQPIWLVGHSLGGVLAILSSFCFKNPEINVFGIPKIGDETFNLNVKKNKFHNFYIQNDFITSLPMFTNEFTTLDGRIIPNIKLQNKTCPGKLYAHAPINYSLNIKLTQNYDVYNP